MKNLREELNYLLFLGVFVLSFLVLGPLPQLRAQLSNGVNGMFTLNGFVGVGVTAGPEHMTPVYNAAITFYQNSVNGMSKKTVYSDWRGYFQTPPLKQGVHTVDVSHPDFNFSFDRKQGLGFQPLPMDIVVDNQLHLPLEINADPTGAACPATLVKTACGNVFIPQTLSSVSNRSVCPTSCSGAVLASCKNGAYSTQNTCESVIEPGVQQVFNSLNSGYYIREFFGNKIFWTLPAYNYYNYDYFIYDITKQATQKIASMNFPNNSASSKDRLVWSAIPPGASKEDIYLYDPVSGVRNLTNSPSTSEFMPAIDGNKIVWSEYSTDFSYKITLYDIPTATKKVIATSPAGQYYYRPDISGNRIVWMDTAGRIYLYNLTTGQSVLIAPIANTGYMKIDGENLFAQRYNYALKKEELFKIDLSSANPTPKMVYSNSLLFTFDVSGSNVALLTYATSNSPEHVFWLNLTTNQTQQITSHSSRKGYVKISENKIVWTDYRNLKGDFYMYTLPPQCGNGIVEAEGKEECDDGNSINNDKCTNSCLLPKPQVIQGFVQTSGTNPQPIAGATVYISDLTGMPLATVTTQANGSFTTTTKFGPGTFKILMSKAKYTFNPSVLQVQIPYSGTGINPSNVIFTSIQTYVAGTVKTSGANPQPIAGATVAITQAGIPIETVTTLMDGSYTTTGYFGPGPFTVSVSKANYTFNPAILQIQIPYSGSGVNPSSVNFTGTQTKFRIAGTVKTSNTNPQPIAGAAVAITQAGIPIETVTTLMDGSYTTTGYFGPGPFTVSVSKANYTFNPAILQVSIPYSGSGPNPSSVNFTGTLKIQGIPQIPIKLLRL